MKQQPLHVLVIEDNPGDVDLLQKALADATWPFDSVTADTLADGVAELGSDTWDVVVCDLSLPDSCGLDTIIALRQVSKLTPIIVLTSLDSDEVALRALDEGAQDYLVKDQVTPTALDRAIRYAIQRQRNAEMTRLVDELRASERLLEKKNKRLKRLYKTAHRFVDNVSHEFRTPLTVIIEYVSLLRDGLVGPLNADQLQMLDVVSDRACDLNNMVNDMLDISKLEAGMLGVWRRKCRIGDVIWHVRSCLLKKASVKSVELDFDIPEDLPDIYCDDEKTGRVVVNLAVNAIKFCGQPGSVTVRAERDDEHSQVLVSVGDNGAGISPENLTAIFQRFKQVGGSARGSTKGFGLGLNIARELVQLNLGEIGVESTLGTGSRFWFTIPYAQPIDILRRYADRIAHIHNGSAAVSLLTIVVSDLVDDDLAADCHRFLDAFMRRNDLLLPIDQRHWLFAVPAERIELKDLENRLNTIRQDANRNRPAEPLPTFDVSVLGSWLVPGELERLVAVAHDAFCPEDAGACLELAGYDIG